MRWNEIISQVSLLENLDTNLSEQAKALLTNLRKRLEDNKKTLQGNIELNSLRKSGRMSQNEDGSLLEDLEALLKNNSVASSNPDLQHQTKFQTQTQTQTQTQSPTSKIQKKFKV